LLDLNPADIATLATVQKSLTLLVARETVKAILKEVPSQTQNRLGIEETEKIVSSAVA
jgi:hypothetical protein